MRTTQADELAPESKPVQIPAAGVNLNADLTIPKDAKAIVAFAHGSGSSRHSSRNRYVAKTLNGFKFATLLADLLTEEEEVIDSRTRHLRFDIPMLADRLVDIAAWLQREQQTKRFRIGWFGADTGAGAALIAAARHPENIMAVVSRGGRPGSGWRLSTSSRCTGSAYCRRERSSGDRTEPGGDGATEYGVEA